MQFTRWPPGIRAWKLETKLPVVVVRESGGLSPVAVEMNYNELAIVLETTK